MERWPTVTLVLLVSSLACSGLQTQAGAAGYGLASERTKALTLVRAAPTEPERVESLTLELDREGFRELWTKGSAVVRAFPLPGRRAVELELSAFSILTPDARSVVVDQGIEHEVPWPAMRHFRGVVSGDPDSLVSLSLSEGRIAGFVRAWGEQFSFGWFDHVPGHSDHAGLEIRNETVRAASRAPTSFCAEPLTARRLDLRKTRSAAAASTSAATNAGLLIAYIAIDSTVEWFEIFGSVAAAQGQILNIMAQVSTLYENEVQIQLQVPFLRVFASEPDPYDGGSMDASQLLSEMVTEWNENQAAVSRTVAHLFSARPSRQGLAYGDVLCDALVAPGDTHDFAASLMPGVGSILERNLVAHELGHNFSSKHTHCYEPEIDRCASEPFCYEGTPVQTTGTLMSKCDSIVSEFHGRVKNEAILPAAIAAVPLCMDIEGEPIAVEDLTLDKSFCKHETLATDDDEFDSAYYGPSLITWVKRLTPNCYPFALSRVDAYMPEPAVNRDLLLLVYTDSSGSGSPTNATLVHTQPETPTSVGFLTFDLDTPVHLAAGDFYLGFQDLVSSAGPQLIAARDRDGYFQDSYLAENTLNPESFVSAGTFTWMVRGTGGGFADGFVTLNWTATCDGGLVLQDYGIYRGQIGIYDEQSSMTCTTDLRRLHHSDVLGDSFFLVVPQTSLFEGSYGQDSEGVERPQADLPCKPQLIGTCPD